MVWTLETSNGMESDKIAHLVVPYLQGRCLDVGCGMRKVWPGLIGIDNGHHFGRGAADIKADGTDLSMFADESMDGIFSSHFLEHVPKERVPAVLDEWARVLKIGGYLCLYLPSANLYPRIGEPGANPDHKWDPTLGDVQRLFKQTSIALKLGHHWHYKRFEERGDGCEYSIFVVVQKLAHPERERALWERNPDGRKRCLVVRYGAIGDLFVAAAILPELKRQGYHITFNGKPSAREILRHDPNIDEWIIQDEDFVPNEQLGPYWAQISTEYDKVVNLCESVESSLLALPGRLNHMYGHDARRALYDHVNYLERTADIAGVPHRFDGRFYMTENEKDWAAHEVNVLGGPVVAWALNGSSPHKVYPFIQIVAAWLVERAGAHVFLLADGGIGAQLQAAILDAMSEAGADMSRVHPKAGVWSIRQAISFAHFADVVVGPETGLLNSVAFASVPKVVYLSHSTATNLTKHWKRAAALAPPEAKVPCYPCHMLHSDWTHCHQVEETGAALCASSIRPERVFEAVMDAVAARVAA